MTRDQTYYKDETTHRRQSKRTRELISELEEELSILDCPGEYDELPVAVVADELGLTYVQVRSLIRLGEIEAVGRASHERINRAELELIVVIGVPELLRRSQQEPAEIFEHVTPFLQDGDIETARRAYKRLEARQSWRGPYAPAFLVGLELASGELDDALSSIKLIYALDDPLRRIAVMTYLGHLLRGMKLKEKEAQKLCEQLIMITDGVSIKHGRYEGRRSTQSRRENLYKLQQQAIYLTTAVMNEMQKFSFRGMTPRVEFHQIIQNTIYTALYSEFFYEDSAASRMYVDMISNMIPENYQPADLMGNLFKKSGSTFGR